MSKRSKSKRFVQQGLDTIHPKNEKPRKERTMAEKEKEEKERS